MQWGITRSDLRERYSEGWVTGIAPYHPGIAVNSGRNNWEVEIQAPRPTEDGERQYINHLFFELGTQSPPLKIGQWGRNNLAL